MIDIIRTARTVGLAAWLVAGATALGGAAGAQDLEDLVEENQRQEEQMRRIPGTEQPGLLTGDDTGRMRLPEGEDVQRVRIAQDRQIDPTQYIVGPGDVMQLYIWGEFDQDIPFEVNPEGKALVPTIGVFDVAGRTLAAVQEQIAGAAAEQSYPGVEITLTLQSMRFFTVYVTGAVLQGDGAHVINPVTRLSDLIERAGGFLDEFEGVENAQTGSGRQVRRLRPLTEQPAGRRSIRVHHRDGTSSFVDLAMYAATGDIRHNPYLRMGDIVQVDYMREQVFAYGSVVEEGTQEWRPGDTVDDLLTLARGVSNSAPLAQVELWRFVDDTDSIAVMALVSDTTAEQARTRQSIADIPLEPGDMLFVRTRSNWRQTPTVHAHGEVRYAGRYRIRQGRTLLTEFIANAGGFTANANLVEARVIRTKYRAIPDPEFERLRGVVEAGGIADLTPEERAYLKTKQREERGRLAIDFERLFAGNDASQDILLEGGDVVYVPEKRLTVSLSGQLEKPGLVDFEEGRRVGFYLEQAGSFTFDADKGAARLIRARTGLREQLDANLVVEPGDEIWVPEKEYRDWWALTQSAMRTTAEALTLILLVRAI